MDIITATVELSNPRQPQLSPLETSAMVDTGAMTICIPEHIAVQLQLPEIEKREVTTADERPHVVPIRGPRSKFVSRIGPALPVRWCWAIRCSSAPSPWKIWTS